MPTISIGAASLKRHKQLRGKIEITPKAPVRTKRDLSLFYTPGVAAVSSYLAMHKSELRDYTMKRNTVAVISDGSAVLGLGNIGPEGALPVMEGKAMLFKTLADIDAFPLVLDTQETDEIITTIRHVAPVFGGINLEDIAAPQCFEVERRLKEVLDIPVLHDDQHGTAMVVLAGLINAFRVVKKDMARSRVVVVGAGAAGNAITNLLLKHGVGDLILLDSRGIVCEARSDMNPFKVALARVTNREKRQGGLEEALPGADALVGVSKGNTVTSRHIRLMHPRAIVFALANPVPEIMPDKVHDAGAAVVATGRSDFPNQINNALGFPGIFRGALDHGVKEITETMLLAAAKNLAAVLKKPTARQIVPSPFDKRVVPAVARAIKKGDVNLAPGP